MSHKGYEEALRRIKKAKEENSIKLSLSSLALTELPPELFELASLRRLDLFINKITAIPDSFGSLVNLQHLSLSRNRITAIPDFLGSLVNLRHLSISGNRITTIPDSLGSLANLQVLFLHNNQIAALTDSLGSLANLRQLYLSDNQTTVIPDSLGDLANLRELYLSENKIAAIPDSLSSLANLHMLKLSNNQITAIPDSLGDLANLEALNLSNNQIAAIPDSLGSLANLRTLNLSNNQIAVLPDSSLGSLTNLRGLFLHNNPDLGLPSELLGPTWQEVRLRDNPSADPAEIIEYARRVNANGRPLNEAKLILVGKGAVGKSSLVEKLKYGTFEPGKAKTEGINIERWELPIKDENILLNVWDFGGQEIMHATHQFFLTERSLYLLVLNGREGTEDLEAEYWLKLIESFGGNSPVIIVLNKINEHPFDLNRSSLLEKYPNIKAFIRTDCEDEESIAELKKAIVEQTDVLDELRVKFPGEWFSVKDELATTDRNYLSFEEYRKLCADNGVLDSRHQEMLAKYLNQLGIVLNYRDDPRLKHTHVLNPHWVTKGIYKVLNSPLLEENKGEINLGEIARILIEPDYPSFMCRFIFDMMKKFDLCFTFPDDDQHYLIPELLPKNQPEEAKEFVAEQCLNFQYHYRILPEGLLPRFITRTHFLSESEAKFRWRSGVILRFENCRALVKADIAEKKVFVSVMGDNAESRRRLLAVVRSDLERIHNEIKHLNPIEMVPLPDAPEVLVPFKDLEVMEQSGLTETKQVARGEVRTYQVKDLLHGVDVPKYAARSPRKEDGRNEVDIFISYSHKDESFRKKMETHLKILHRQNLIKTWSDRDIIPGEKWGEKIDDKLEGAEIILILVSADFLDSDYCYDIEMRRALERHNNNEAVLLPVIIKECNWQGAPFGKLEAMPEKGKAVNLFAKQDTAWTQISKRIEEIAKNILATREDKQQSVPEEDDDDELI